MPTSTATEPKSDVPLIDPRVAKHGGTRTNPRKHYEYPRMTPDGFWRSGKVHKATSYYGCALCGTRLRTPHAIYTHLAKVHDR